MSSVSSPIMSRCKVDRLGIRRLTNAAMRHFLLELKRFCKQLKVDRMLFHYFAFFSFSGYVRGIANLQFWSFFSLRSGWFNFLTLFFVIHENHPKDQTFVHSSPQTPFLHAFFSHEYSSPGHGMFPRLSVALPRLLPRLQALRRRPLRAL